MTWEVEKYNSFLQRLKIAAVKDVKLKLEGTDFLLSK